MNTLQRKIEILPESVKHMIAAGEVVQGPFSVIKELIENAIDAEATAIDIMTEQSGLSCIRVIDNGRGIPAKEISLAIVEHATSKIRTISDIETIASYGFRGEALSSISSVSRLTIASRTADEQAGARLHSDFGEASVEHYHGQKGTTVLVEELFFNTPARKKFLKSVQGESRNSLRTVTSLALARYDIAFSYMSDGKIIYQCPAATSLSERIGQLFGSKDSAHLIEGEITDIEVKISGAISDGSLYKPTRAGQYIFVNNRPIENASFSFHIRRAYDSLLASGKHPHAYIYITLPPGLADVNVHPAKKEIRFFDEAYMGSLIHGFCRSLLNKSFSISIESKSSKGNSFVGETDRKNFNDGDISELHSSDGKTFFGNGIDASRDAINGRSRSGEESRPFIPPQINDSAGNAENTAGDNRSSYEYRHPFMPRVNTADESNGHKSLFSTPVQSNAAIHAIQTDSMLLYGTLFATYVLASLDDELLIVDFHAAHERIIYDRLMAKVESTDKQLLMVPHEIHFVPSQRLFIGEIIAILQDAGFDVEEFSEDSIVIRAVPALVHVDDSEAFFKELLEYSTEGASFIHDKKKLVFERIACHSAKRAGDVMSTEDMRELMRILLSGSHELRCPHGRPFIFRLSRSELEKYFSRRV